MQGAIFTTVRFHHTVARLYNACTEKKTDVLGFRMIGWLGAQGIRGYLKEHTSSSQCPLPSSALKLGLSKNIFFISNFTMIHTCQLLVMQRVCSKSKKIVDNFTSKVTNRQYASKKIRLQSLLVDMTFTELWSSPIQGS